MKICVLRSGSSGNCSIIEDHGSHFLLDAGGMSQKGITELLNEVNISLGQINGLLVTHTHSDHINYSTIKVCEKNNIPIYIHSSNIPVVKESVNSTIFSKLKLVPFEKDSFMITKGVQITPFDVSHDAAKITSGFSIMESEGAFVTYAADLGYFPDSLIQRFVNAKIVFLEANHDPDLLWKNPARPFIHKKRVAGDMGHLSNFQSADALIKIINNSDSLPEKIVLCHLSRDHNSPELAKETVEAKLNENGVCLPVLIAKRKERTEFFDI